MMTSLYYMMTPPPVSNRRLSFPLQKLNSLAEPGAARLGAVAARGIDLLPVLVLLLHHVAQGWRRRGASTHRSKVQQAVETKGGVLYRPALRLKGPC